MAKTSKLSADDPLAGITTKTTRPQLMERLKELAKRVQQTPDTASSTHSFDEVKKRVKAKGTPGVTTNYQTVIVLATDQEWGDTSNFLKEFDGFLPAPLQRLLTGWEALVAEKNSRP